MNDLDPVSAAIDNAQPVTPMDQPPPPGPPDSRPDPAELPPGFPVVPLGHAAGIYHFLSGRGELVSLSAGAMAKRAELVALFSGRDDAQSWLKWVADARTKGNDEGFNASGVADFLVAASAVLPLYDGAVSTRRRGTWRGPENVALAHCGDLILEHGRASSRAGQKIGQAVYAAAARGPAPGKTSCPAEDVRSLRDAFQSAYAWQRPIDADVLFGWLAQALLGQFPKWRAHIWIEAPSGSGKSTLVELVHLLLGGMSAGIRTGSSEAAVRMATNEMALARLFDEAEGGDDRGHIENIIGLFRLMSGADGARIERAGIGGGVYHLYGAGLFASVLPGAMRPQDRNRFLMLVAKPRPPSADPIKEAKDLADMQDSALFYGPLLWRRMLEEAHRFDRAHTTYSALVQALGGDRRGGDTIGVTLAGWDLLLHDGPPDEARLARARVIAEGLIEDASEAASLGEGERCLLHLMGSYVAKDHGGSIPVAELVSGAQSSPEEPAESEDRLLGRMGLRVLRGERWRRDLFVVSAAHPQLERAFAGTPWRAGGHKSALLSLDGAEKAQPTRVAGSQSRGIRVPARFLPGAEL